MTIFNLGSINIDNTYTLEAFPQPGETLTAAGLEIGLGGKGANQSIAAVRAGGTVWHIGAIGQDGAWILAELQQFGIDTKYVDMIHTATGHAIIYVDRAAENSIVLFDGANRAIKRAQIERALSTARPGNWLLLQNETNMGAEAADLAKSKGLRVAYSAAPFDRESIRSVLPFTDLLVVNEIEYQSLTGELVVAAERLSEMAVVVTKGAQGADYISNGKTISVDAFRANPVDTTGAGDTFLGYLLAKLNSGTEVERAMRYAAAAAAIQVTRKGAASAIPDWREVDAFLAADGAA